MKRNKTDEKTFMSRLSINSIEDKGSISVYVIVTLVFLSIVLISMLAASKNSVITSLKSRETIKNIYENDVASIDEIYSIEIVKNSGSSEPPDCRKKQNKRGHKIEHG